MIARSPQARSARRQAGFTILEVMIAMAVLAFMVMITWATTSQLGASRKHVRDATDRSHEIRVATSRMVRDISQAYLSENQNTTDAEPRTFFVGESGSSHDELRFSSFGHTTIFANANESEQTVIAYQVADDPDDRRQKNLVRRSLRRLSYEDWEQQPADYDVLVHDIEKLELEYWDWEDKDWKRDWNTTSADGERGKLPTRVRIKLTVVVEGDEVVHTTQARIIMEEQLRFFSN